MGIKRNCFQIHDLRFITPARDCFGARGPQIGQKVMLVSGGPEMLVVDFGRGAGSVVAAWRQGKRVVEREFPCMCLLKAG